MKQLSVSVVMRDNQGLVASLGDRDNRGAIDSLGVIDNLVSNDKNEELLILE